MSKRLLFTLSVAVGAATRLAAADLVTFWNTASGKALTRTRAPTSPVNRLSANNEAPNNY